MDAFVLGRVYTYHDKKTCYANAVDAMNQGYRVRFRVNFMGKYEFQVVDPFDEEEMYYDQASMTFIGNEVWQR